MDRAEVIIFGTIKVVMFLVVVIGSISLAGTILSAKVYYVDHRSQETMGVPEYVVYDMRDKAECEAAATDWARCKEMPVTAHAVNLIRYGLYEACLTKQYYLTGRQIYRDCF